MANYVFNAETLPNGQTINIYIGGTTSTTTLDSNLLSLTPLQYDMSDIGRFYAGSISLEFDDFQDDIQSNWVNIKNQIWIVDVGGTEYYRGSPVKTTAKFNDHSNDAKVFSVTLSAISMDASNTSSASLTKFQTNWYSLGQFIEQMFVTATGLSATDVIYLNTLSYSVQGNTIYLDYADALSGLSGVDFIVLKDNEPKPKDLFNKILLVFGLNASFWKGKLYLWRKDTYSGSITVTDSDIVGSINYLPSYKKNDYFDSLEMKISTNSAYDNALGYVNLFDENTRIIAGDDRLPSWSSHSFGNWTDTQTNNLIDTTTSTNIDGLEGVQTRFVIYDTGENTNLTLDTLDFDNAIPDNSLLKFTFQAGKATESDLRVSVKVGSNEERFVLLDTSNKELYKQYELEYPVNETGDIQIRINADEFDQQKQIRYTGILNFYILKWENHGIIDDGSLSGYEFEVSNATPSGYNTVYTLSSIGSKDILVVEKSSGYTSGTTYVDCDAYLVKENITINYNALPETRITWTDHKLNIGDYVQVYNCTESSFDGTYQITKVYDADLVAFAETPYTSDTSGYTADLRYKGKVGFLSNVNCGIIKKDNKEIEDYSGDEYSNLYPNAYYQSSPPDRPSNYELCANILDQTQSANISRFGTEELQRLEMTVDLDTINPYSRVVYNSVNYWVENMSFDFKSWQTRLILTEAV